MGHRFIPGVNIRENNIAVTAGANTIIFTTELPSTGYTLLLWLYNSLSERIEVDPNTATKTVSGFTISIPEAGNLVYVAISPM